MPVSNKSFNCWTVPQIAYAGVLWRQNLSAERIADALADRFEIVVSKNSVLSIARKNRDLMPIKSGEARRAAIAAGRQRYERTGR